MTQDMQDTILALLARRAMAPAALARACGISRQAVHRHLKVLQQYGLVGKEGTAPHVTYHIKDAAPQSRVRESYAFAADKLLPRYRRRYAHMIARALKRCERRARTTSQPDRINLRFLIAASAVYSSNIEGNTMDLNSFLNANALSARNKPHEAKEIDDLVQAYAFVRTHRLTEKNFLAMHKQLIAHVVAPSRRGVYRRESVGVFSARGPEYIAIEPQYVAYEMRALFDCIAAVRAREHAPAEVLFWASWLHMMIALIHPFVDGNGRIARLAEKWLLVEKFGTWVFVLPSERYYHEHRSSYYAALALGAHYYDVDFARAMAFLRLLPRALAACDTL